MGRRDRTHRLQAVVRRLCAAAAFVMVAALLGPASWAVGATQLSVVPLRQIGGEGHAELYAWGAATRPDGSVLIGDYWNHRIVHYAKDGTLLGTVVGNMGSGAEQHLAPYGIAVDPTNGDIYLGDVDGNRTIDKYDSDGNFLLTWGGNGTGPGKFRYPARIAVSSVGRVYVADQWDHNIVIHDSGGAEIDQFGTQGGDDGQFRQPRGMAFDADDRLYVVDNYNRRVQVFDADGNFLFRFGESGTGPGQFAPGSDLRGLAIDSLNGWVYVVDAASGYVNKFDLDGRYLLRFGGFGTEPGRFPGGGREITVDGDGNVWVGDMPQFRVQKFAPDGTLLFARPDPAAPPPPGGFNAPRGVALDRTGNVYVTDTHNWRVQKFAPDGSHLLEWGRRAGGSSGFNYQRGIDVDPRDDTVVVADTDNHLVKKFDPGGTLLWSVGGFGAAPGRFTNPHSLDVAADGRIYVADTQNHRIQLLDEDGNALFSFGERGAGDGQFMFPRGIDVADDGTVWVTDSIRGDVQQFDADGHFLGSFGQLGTTDDRFDRLADIAVDDTYVYIADADANKVKIWTREGSFVQAFGGSGSTLGSLRRPHGLDMVAPGHLYVVEQSGARVQEFLIEERPADAEPPDAEVDTPAPQQAFEFGPPVALSGTATDDVGVASVQVAVKDRNTDQWWRTDGTWGAFQAHDASMADPGARSTPWSFDWVAPTPGSFGLLVRAFDGAGNVDPSKPWVAFTVQDGPLDSDPPDGHVDTPTPDDVFPLGPVPLTGTATDDVGIALVQVAIKDRGTGLWWHSDGTWGAWRLHDAVLDAPGEASTSWSRTWTPPAAGQYGVIVRTDDTSGNTDPTKPWVPFTVSE